MRLFTSRFSGLRSTSTGCRPLRQKDASMAQKRVSPKLKDTRRRYTEEFKGEPCPTLPHGHLCVVKFRCDDSSAERLLKYETSVRNIDVFTVLEGLLRALRHGAQMQSREGLPRSSPFDGGVNSIQTKQFLSCLQFLHVCLQFFQFLPCTLQCCSE